MNTISHLSDFIVGIYISQGKIHLCTLHFNLEKVSELSFKYSPHCTKRIEQKLTSLVKVYPCCHFTILLSATSPCGFSLANALASSLCLANYLTALYCLPSDLVQNAQTLALLSRHRRLCLHSWRGSQYLTLQKLTHRRTHLIYDLITEKLEFISHLLTGLSFFSPSRASDFSNFSRLKRYCSPEQIALSTPEALLGFLFHPTCSDTKYPEEIDFLIHQADRNSFRLKECPCDTLPLLLASSANCIRAYEQELAALDRLIERTCPGLCPLFSELLLSFPGMNMLYVSGILAEIGSLCFFTDAEHFLQYAGPLRYHDLYSNTFGDHFYLRHYLAESVRRITFFQEDDDRKSLKGITRPRLFYNTASLQPAIKRIVLRLFEEYSKKTPSIR